MASKRSSTSQFRHRGVRTLGATLALVLAGLSIGSYQEERVRIRELRGMAIDAGFIDDLPLLESLDREGDSHRGALRLARAILSRDLTPEPTVPRGSQLQRARTLGRDVLTSHPAAWQAPMILGAATYLEWSLGKDGRLFRQPDQWQSPLLRSLDLGPGRNEPTQFLASAYLELWPALSESRQKEARTLVARAMADPKHFSRLLVPWLERAVDRQEAFDIIPEDPQAWDTVAKHYASRLDWNAFVEARDRKFQARKVVARDLLAQGRARLAGRDLRGARHFFLSAAMVAPESLDMDSWVQEALDKAPSGPFNPHYSSDLRKKLTRALALYLHREAPLEPSAIARLEVASGDLPPQDRALAALAAGDLPKAELMARRAGAQPWTPEWSPYKIARARVLLQRGDLEGAADSLHQADARWRLQPVYWNLHKELAQRQQDPSEERRAEERLNSLMAENLPPGAWQVVSPRRQRLIVWGHPEPTTLSLELAHQPALGGAVAIHVDGQIVDRWVLPTSRPLEFFLDTKESEIHVLEIEVLAGGSVTPGRLRVAPPSR